MAVDWLKNLILDEDERKALTNIGGITTAKEFAKVMEKQQAGLTVGEFDYNQNIDQAYAKNAISYFCINLKADAMSEPRVELWSNGKLLKNPPTSHKLFGLWSLIHQPNNMMDWADLIKQYSIFFDLAGECFLRRLPDVDAILRGNGSIHLINPSIVDIKDGMYIIKNGDDMADIKIPILPDKESGREILHRTNWHPTSLRGLSALTPAWLPVRNHNMGLEWNFSLLSNSARLGLVAILKKSAKGSKITQEQLDEINDEMAKFTGPKNTGKTMTLSGDWDLQEFGQSQRDLEWNTMLETMGRLIALSLKVDPIFLGFKGDSSFSNKREAYVGLYKFTILPALAHFKSDFEHWMREIFPGDWEIRFNLDDVAALEPVREALWDRANTAFSTGLLTRDEAREMVGFAALPEDEKVDETESDETDND